MSRSVLFPTERSNHRLHHEDNGSTPSFLVQVHLQCRDQTHTFEAPSGEPILFAAIRQRFEIPYGCASGTCGTCRVKHVSGSVANAWAAAPGMNGADPQANEILLCQCSALEDLVVETRSLVGRSATDAPAVGYVAGRLQAGRTIAREVMEFSVTLESPMSFEAGQFVALRVPGIDGRRVYSMTNFHVASSRLEFVVKRKAAGAFTTRLFSEAGLTVPVEVFGPLGRATFAPSLAKDVLVVAGGSGIAGMMSILGRAVEGRHFDRHSGHVFFGVRTWADAFYLERLSEMARTAGPRLAITVALSDEDVPPHAQGKFPALAFARGLVHEVAAKALEGRGRNVRAYVAGPPLAVEASLRSLLKQVRVPLAEIRYDKFE